jgi:hypothetical protein
MLEFASDAQPHGSITPIRGLRALGEEAPLRAALENGERLLVCAVARFFDRPSSQPLWLTDRRFIFTRSQGRMRKLLISVPIAGSSLNYERAALFPLRLDWIGPDGSPRAETFRAYTWKDSVSSDGSAGAAGGASAGIAGAVIGLAVMAAIKGAVGNRGIASSDQKLLSLFQAAQRAPGQVRPVDLTLNPGSRLMIGGFMALLTAALVGAGVFALVQYQVKQAYEAAPLCDSVTGPNCRLLQPAVVTAHRGASGKNAYCDLFLTTAEGSNVEADLHNFTLCAQDPRGQQMFLEYWRHSLTGVIPVGAPTQVIPAGETGDNPEYNWRFGAVMAGILGPLWLIFGSLCLVAVIGWVKRRSLLRASAYAAGYLN